MKKNNIHKYDDQELITSFLQTSDSTYFGELYQRYYKKVFAHCFAFTYRKDKATAEDLTQQVFLKVLERLASYKGTASFSTWLFVITRNTCIDYSRIKMTPLLATSEIKKSYVDDTEEEIRDIDADYQHLISCIYELEDNEKDMMVDKYINNCSIKELAFKYRLSESALKMRLMRIRRRLSKKRSYLNLRNAV